MKSLWRSFLYVTFLQLFSLNMVVHATSASAPQGTTVPQTQPYINSVKQFLAADFDGQMILLQKWPSSPESLNQFMAVLDNDELYYSEAQGQPYSVNDQGQVLDFITQQPVAVSAENLQSYSANNAIRSLIEAHRANDDLTVSDPALRLAAANTLLENALAADDALIAKQLAVEQDPQIHALLVKIQNQKDLSSDSLERQLKAAKNMAASSDPEVLSMIDEKLTDGSVLTPALKAELEQSKSKITSRIKMSEYAGYAFSGISLGSILLLAALGLAITYGLLGVINMAHGELIMIGAYATYMIQNVFVKYAPDFLGWYLIVAIPIAFLVTALIGVVIERIIIKPLYGRQLETLLATFGVSLILMQLTRMIFGAQNVEVANVSWLSGGLAISPSLTLPYSRIAIIGFTFVVLAGLYFMISKTRLGLFVRAVTQNRQMAKAVGVRSDRVDMMAFGIGSGLAGLAGCALSQITNVGPDLGQNYIIDAFLVVVVGGVGQLLGATIAAFSLGVGNKIFEVMMGAVLAKILVLALIILFIQKRPQGLFAIKGRFVE